jgi:TRAP-type C4-dicarboxylate transport system permease small subunit
MFSLIVNKMSKFCNYFCGFALVLMVFDICYVVLLRYVFKSTPIWGEELARMCMVYLCFIGFSIGIRYDVHIRVTMFDIFLPRRLLRILDCFMYVVLLSVSVFLLVEGVNLTIIGHGNVITGMQIPTSVLMICIPIGAFFNIFQIIYRWKRST